MITKRRYIVDLLDDDNNNETEQFIRKYGADEITGMTNGDVIKALFPDADISLNDSCFEGVVNRYGFDEKWWNAPYEAESEGMTCQKKALRDS